MLIKEFRVVMPLTVEEYQIGQLYSVAETSLNETGGGEGIEVIKNEPFENFPLLGGEYSRGQYTFKKYHLASKVPAYIRLLAPKGALELHEKAWNAYPYCRTVISNPTYMKENFFVTIESLHLPDKGDQYNVHQLPPGKLKQREVIIVDIANDRVSPSDYKPLEDPSQFHSEATGRGPLTGRWMESASPVMTCYKLVTVEFKWFGLQNRVESWIEKTQQRLFTNFHRQVFCWIDRWQPLSMDDIRVMEERIRQELDRARKTGEVRGLKAEAE